MMFFYLINGLMTKYVNQFIAFLLTLKHNFSIAIRRSDNDIVCFKGLFLNSLYPLGSGIFLKMIIIPVLH